MNSRPKTGKRVSSQKARKTFGSFNFFQGCNTSLQPEWAAPITRFKLVRRTRS